MIACAIAGVASVLSSSEMASSATLTSSAERPVTRVERRDSACVAGRL